MSSFTGVTALNDQQVPAGVRSFSPLAHLLAEAQREQVALRYLPEGMAPANEAMAYQIQLQTLALCHEKIAGWKVGAKSETGPVSCAPLAEKTIFAPGVCIDRQRYAPCGLELELAFRLNREFLPRSERYDPAEIHAAISQVAVTMEIVTSRFTLFPDLPELAMLADLQNNGGLVVGEWQPVGADFPFLSPAVRWQHDGINIIQKPVPGNPAGDPRRLLPWLVNHCARNDIAVTPDMILTCGSYTGFYRPSAPGQITGQIEGLPGISLTLV